MLSQNHFFATCSKGCEDILLSELNDLGITQTKNHVGGIAFEGELAQSYQVCLWSRVASRILLQLKTFEIDNDNDLYDEVLAIDWSEHFDVDKTFVIDCFSSHSEVNNSHFASLRVKDAIVDQFIKKQEQRPSIERDNPDIRLNLYLSDKQCLIYLDLSGEALHKRGYRLERGEAPLRETLAAAILYRAKWRDFYQKNLPIQDPMCGSATLLIEAALMTMDIAPAILREQFGFTHWKQFNPADWSAIYQDAIDRKQQGLTAKHSIIFGSDNDEKNVGIARKNIKQAGLADKIKIFLQDVTKEGRPCSQQAGLVVCNPPYGKRLGQVQQLRTLYYRFGLQLKANFDGWTVAVITSEVDLAKSIGLRAFHKNTLFNGAIKSILYQYKVNKIAPHAKPESEDGLAKQLQSTRSFDKGELITLASKTETSLEKAQMFHNRLKKNHKHLKKWARKNSVSCYRVYDADIPQYAFAIDIYQHYVYLQEYQAPKTIDKNRAFQRVNDVLDSVAEILERKPEHVVLKTRKKQSGLSQYERQDEKNYKMVITENDLKFLVNIYDYIDTGIFLDHRNTRALIKNMSANKDFLNLFSYTGTVTVYAVAGGARSSTTIDMSNTYLNWAQENLALNNLDGHDHQYIREDCLQWLKQAVDMKKKYQLIFVDPPTFSNSKKMDEVFDIKRDHLQLLQDCLQLLSADGNLIFSTNAKGFKLDENIKQYCDIKELTHLTTTEDFRRKPQHRSWQLSLV